MGVSIGGHSTHSTHDVFYSCITKLRINNFGKSQFKKHSA